ncbi:Aste57867_3582 [Aphanomyces stellatus]|uniref:Aste57867_3582 protein n=1 Tax=Aphanomyces stellatus TaxID=120398 RepID=A0A485KDW1_9STRA|nr:hypothetical protein As57867_003571 [Aphanomyces stellatus]VFT80743.1 Aste57867_3582 [Aphanomyces stellatus]
MLAFSGLIQHADAHGRLLVPPHRGYIGKLPQFSFIPKDYSDHGLNAGGISQTSGGQHGVCGDPFSGVRDHETGGMYGTFPTNGAKAIGGCYAPGATVDIQIQITANHKGFFEFGLCKLNGKADKETEECFQSLAQPNGEKQWQLPAGAQTFSMQYKLPSGVTCDGDSHCVLRWWYAGGNNPGVGINGQEQFWNCADIYISNNCGGNGPSPNPSSAKPTPSTSLPNPEPSSQKPQPSQSTPAPSKNPVPSPSSNPSPAPQPPSGDCGSCSNCYYAPTKSCFVGWTSAQCSSVSTYKWCGKA